MTNRFAFAALALCFSSSLVAQAQAQGRPIGLADRKGGRDHALELDFDWSSVGDEVTYTTLLPTLYGSFGLTDKLEFEVTLPLVFVDISPEEGEGDSTFMFANPYVALFYASRTARSVARIGVGVGLPLIDLDMPEDFGEAIAASAAYGTRGLRDAWLYFPDTMSLVLPAQVQMRSSLLVIGIDGALGVLLATDSEVRDDDVEVALDLGAMVGVALDDITLGMRLQMGGLLTEDGDTVQVSVLPFIQADLDGGGFFHGGLLVNLDKPLGVIANEDDSELWAIRLGGGARF